MNYLASPPLVVAYALAGTMDIDLVNAPLATDRDGLPVYLADLWPAKEDIDAVVGQSIDAEMFHTAYAGIFDGDHRWQALDAPVGDTFAWAADSTYVRRPPHFDNLCRQAPPVSDIVGARVLVKLGDSVTTDHISPAGAITPGSDAGRYLTDLGVSRRHLDTFASRRGNHEVLMRGAFANVRLRNQIAPDTVGGFTRCFDADAVVMPMHRAATTYRDNGTPLAVIAGKDYGAGSSRDWAAKGPRLLGVRAVLAESFERIHRSNLICMGVLPLQFLPGESAASLGLTGEERSRSPASRPSSRTSPTVTSTSRPTAAISACSSASTPDARPTTTATAASSRTSYVPCSTGTSCRCPRRRGAPCGSSRGRPVEHPDRRSVHPGEHILHRFRIGGPE